MFERFTDKARRTVVLAQEEATLLEHDHIGTEHILLGLLRESGGAAASVLTSLGVSLDAARASVENADGRGPGAAGHIPFTPEAKRTLELALREALQLGHDYIGTGHILLGLTTDPGCKGAEVLMELGAGLDAVREGVIELRPADDTRVVRRTHPAAAVESATRFADLTARLAAVERRVGTAPNLAGLDGQIARFAGRRKQRSMRRTSGAPRRSVTARRACSSSATGRRGNGRSVRLWLRRWRSCAQRSSDCARC